MTNHVRSLRIQKQHHDLPGFVATVSAFHEQLSGLVTELAEKDMKTEEALVARHADDALSDVYERFEEKWEEAWIAKCENSFDPEFVKIVRFRRVLFSHACQEKKESSEAKSSANSAAKSSAAAKSAAKSSSSSSKAKTSAHSSGKKSAASKGKASAKSGAKSSGKSSAKKAAKKPAKK